MKLSSGSQTLLTFFFDTVGANVPQEHYVSSQHVGRALEHEMEHDETGKIFQ